MKKLFSLVLLFCLMISYSVAENINLTDLSFDELQILQQRIEAEIVTRPEWKGVEVPIGCWRIGIDIPVGSYSIEIKDSKRIGNVYVWGYASQDFETNGGLIHNKLIGQKQGNIGKIELIDGWVLEVTYPVILKPAQRLDF